MKGLFVVFEALTEHSGISKKIKAQIDGFKNNGVNMELSCLLAHENKANMFKGRIADGQIIERYSELKWVNKFQRISRFKKLFEYIQDNKISLVYIRYVHTANPYFIKFLKDLKKNNIQVLLEVPTYPYDQEYEDASVLQKFILVIEKIYRKQFKYHINHIVTFSNDPKIFGVPTIRISNGIDITKINLVTDKLDNNEIRLVGVASLSFWHGFDRLLEGINNYYKTNQEQLVFFSIVGDINTSEAIKYQVLVEKYKLQNYVTFHGKLVGEELDEVFNESNVGVGCLGVHRKGITFIKSIKNREYCARGIPFIYSEMDTDFDDKPYVLKVAADESAIEIESIVKFMKANQFDKNEMRSFAKEYLTWNSQIQTILNQTNYTG